MSDRANDEMNRDITKRTEISGGGGREVEVEESCLSDTEKVRTRQIANKMQ